MTLEVIGQQVGTNDTDITWHDSDQCSASSAFMAGPGSRSLKPEMRA